MAEKIRILVQMRYSPKLNAARSAAAVSPSSVPSITVPGFSLDQSFTPVKLSSREPRESIGQLEVGRLFTFRPEPEKATYLLRGEVEDSEVLKRLVDTAAADPECAGVFSDPRIEGIAVCPQGAVGSHEEVANRLENPMLHGRGMDGTNVMVAIVDTGFNIPYLQTKGKNPNFDASKSWTPIEGYTPGNMPVDHGTMCAFDVCIAAPNCTLLDYALLLSQAGGETVMEGFLSDAVKAYGNLLELIASSGEESIPLVVNNSWGMYHPSWDFPIGHPGNYSDNPEHPFNIIVESLEDAGADILFAAGNCGPECPSSKCLGFIDRPIYGANSHPSVLCVAGVTVNKVRLGYSSQGPGRLDLNKPDICAYSHFLGSEVYPTDSGTSAACPVAAGVVAAVRSVYSPAEITPAQLRNMLRRSCEDLSLAGFDYGHGYGLINVSEFLNALDQKKVRELRIGELVFGSLEETGATTMFHTKVGSALNIELDGPQGIDLDIYARKGAEPTVTEYDYRGFTSSADEKIRIDPVEPDDYYVMVRSYRGVGDFTIKAVLE